MAKINANGRTAWNLSIDSRVKRAMEIKCKIDEVDPSEVTEQLYREYLAKSGVAVPIVLDRFKSSRIHRRH